MNLVRIERDIVDRLSVLRSLGLQVKALPDQIAEFTQPRVNGWILVMFPEDSVERPSVRSPIVQSSIITLRLDIRLRHLRNHPAESCWLLLEAVRKLLIGFVPSGARGPIYANAQQLLGRDDGDYWHWQSDFSIPALVRAAEEDEDTTAPLLNRLTFLFDLSDRWEQNRDDLSDDVDEQLIIDREPSP